MPIYTVEGPDGRRYKIEGPEGATADQLAAVIQQQAPAEQPAPPPVEPQAAPVQQEQSTGERLLNANTQMGVGAVEPILAMGSGMARAAWGGLKGLAETAFGDGADAGAEVVRAEQAKAYTPQTAGGQLSQQVIAAPAVPVAVATEKTSEALGEAGYQQGGPTAGTFGYMLPALVETVYGAKGARAVRPQLKRQSPLQNGGYPVPRQADAPPPPPTEPPRNTLPERVPDKGELMAEKIREGSTDAEVAPYKLDEWEGVRKDPKAAAAAKQGFSEGVVAAIKQASPKDRQSMLKMLDIRKRGHRNERYAVDNRPADVAGDSALQRVRHVKKVNRQAGRALELEARKLRGQQVDYAPPVTQFLENLKGMGVRLDGDLKPIFKGSDIEGVKAAERIVQNIVGRMRNTKVPDAYDLHRLKRFIDEHVTYGKSADGLGGKTERVLKQLRRDLDSTLDSAFPEYNRVNTTYADTVGVLDSLQGIVGGKVDLFGENADKAMGIELRSLMNNTKKRANMMGALDDLDSVATKYGGKFDDDIKTQMLFADELDRLFGSSGRTALGGQMEQAIEGALDAAAGGQTMTGLGISGAKWATRKARRINDDNAFKAMRDLLEE